MEGYKRIYVVNGVDKLEDDGEYYGGCCEVAYSNLDDAKAKYNEMKQDALEYYKECRPEVHYEEDEYAECIHFYADTLYAVKTTIQIIKIEYLDLKIDK